MSERYNKIRTEFKWMRLSDMTRILITFIITYAICTLIDRFRRRF